MTPEQEWLQFTWIFDILSEDDVDEVETLALEFIAAYYGKTER
jgi:hypothetical protein